MCMGDKVEQICRDFPSAGPSTVIVNKMINMSINCSHHWNKKDICGVVGLDCSD